MDVFLPKEENNRPGLPFNSFDEVVPDADSEDEILLVSLN
jgi:hypothetical protein